MFKFKMKYMYWQINNPRYMHLIQNLIQFLYINALNPPIWGLRLLEIHVWSGGGFRRIEAIWDLCAWWIMEDWGYQALFNTRWKWRIEVTCRYSKNEKMDYGGSRLHAGLAKMPKWIMEDLGYCTLFCYYTMYSHFHFLWVGSKTCFCTYCTTILITSTPKQTCP